MGEERDRDREIKQVMNIPSKKAVPWLNLLIPTFL